MFLLMLAAGTSTFRFSSRVVFEACVNLAEVGISSEPRAAGLVGPSLHAVVPPACLKVNPRVIWIR